MDLFAAMTAFVRTAERSSFSSAARDLGLTQPQVTRAVQLLEQRLGARLFHRTTRRLTITEEGRQYLERCRSILADLEDTENSIGTAAKTLSGELRVFAPVSLGRSCIVPRLEEFLDRHPALKINLVLDDRPRDLVADRLDVGIRIGPLAESSQRARKLGEAPRWIVAAPAYWNKHGRPQSPQDLANHVSLIFDGAILTDWVRCQQGSKVVEVPLTGRFWTNSSEAILEATLLGQGVCLAPSWLAAREIKSGRLERVLPDWDTLPNLPVFAVYPETRVPTEKVRSFIDWLAFTFHADGLIF